MSETNKIELRDPHDLKPLAMVKAMPRWGKDSNEFAGFKDDIRDNGIKHPLLITQDGKVVDGETRRQAAVAMQLPEVPCQVVADDEVREIIVRELCRRRNLTKCQLAYLVAPLLEEAFMEGRRRRMENLRKGQQIPVAAASGNGNSAYEWAALLGFSRDLMDRARWLQEQFEQRPDLREEFEPQILNFEKPMALGAAKAGVGFLLTQAKRSEIGEFHTGGKSKDAARQLQLFTGILENTITRWDYWRKFDEKIRAEHFKQVRVKAAALPKADCVEIADYFSRLGAELRKIAKQEAE